MFFVFQKRLQAKSLGILNTLMLESQIGLTTLIQLGGSWAKKNPRHARKKRGFVFCFPKTPSSEKLGRFKYTYVRESNRINCVDPVRGILSKE